jgi:hypothetical protein
MSARASRCDQIIALIDACLADLDSPVCGPFGAGPAHRPSRRPGSLGGPVTTWGQQAPKCGQASPFQSGAARRDPSRVRA